MMDKMADQEPGDEQAQFIWNKKSRSLDKLFMKKEDRRKIKSGRYLHFLVYSWGFRSIDGDNELSGRWEDVATIAQFIMKFALNGINTRTDYAFVGHLEDGRSFGFRDSLWPAESRNITQASLRAVHGVTTAVNAGQLGRIFTARVADVLLPKAISQFNAGQSTTFGPFTVGPAGITEGDESVTWDEVESVQTQSGVVSVKKVGTWRAWKKVPQLTVPNDFVFEALVRTVLAQRTGDGQS